LGSCSKKLDEAQFWLELLVKLELLTLDKVKSTLDEATALVAIFTASRRTAQRRHAASQSR